VGKEIEEGEEDREGFLDTKKAVEGPFAVKLFDWEGRGCALGCYYVLTGIVAFRWAVPEEEAVVEGNGIFAIMTVFLLAHLETFLEFG